MYANGVLISKKTSTSPTVPICPGAEVIVGGWWDSPTPQGINGKMDEVRLYNRALNADEIAKLAQGFPAHEPAPPADLKRGLLLYLPFNGSIADSSGNNNLTQLVDGAALTYDEHGYANSAFGGNGTGGRLIVTNNGSINFDTAFSISLSVMERDNSTRQQFISLMNTATSKSWTFGLGNSQPGTRELLFGVASDLISCNDNATPDKAMNDTSYNFIPQPESWYNIVCTFHKGRQETYINGVLSSTKTSSYTATHICPDAQVVVGGWWDSDPISVNGKLDNVRIYNRVLTSEEIAMLATHYQANSNSIRQVITR